MPSIGPDIHSLAYVDIQHDALAVFDDVEQGVVSSEDIWVSGYKAGESSVHGKAKIDLREGGGSSLVSRDGVNLERVSKTSFIASFSSLGIDKRSVKFPRSTFSPPYKRKPSAAPLHINAIDEHSGNLVVAGSDGFAAIVSHEGTFTELPGHVGDVLAAKWFPSGQVALTASSDLSIRVWGLDGSNPRTLRGHTRAVTSLAIVDVGKEVLSGGKDGTVRLWNIGQGKEVRKWYTDPARAVEEIVLVDDIEALQQLEYEQEEKVVLAAGQDGHLFIFPFSGAPPRKIEPLSDVGNLVCMAYDGRSGVLATGHTSGIIAIRHLGSLDQAWLLRRNESPIYSLAFGPAADPITTELFAGTGAGLPARLRLSRVDEGWAVTEVEELAGWEAVGVETWAVGQGSVWCAGGEGGIRRY